MKVEILQQRLLSARKARKLNEVLQELRSPSAFLRLSKWRRIFAQRDVRIFLCKYEKEITGMAILRWHELPVGKVGTVEDVAVQSEYRGSGYGSALMRAIIAFAKKQKISYIDLTSRPERVAANRLYQKFGWKKRKTNTYRLLL